MISRRLAADACLLAAAFLSFAWAIALPFQLDDFTVVPGAPDFLSARPEGTGAYLCRPVLWTLFVIESTLSGIPLDPAVFHGGSVLIHVLTSFVVLALLRRWPTEGAALAGAVFFAIHPAGVGALTWVSAGGDLLFVLFGVLAALALSRPATPFGHALAGLSLAAALLSKVTAVILIPPFMIAAFAAPRSRPLKARALNLLVFLLPILGALLFRRWYLGTWRLKYAGGSELTLEALIPMAALFPKIVEKLFIPWNQAPGLADTAPFVGTFEVSSGAPIAAIVAFGLGALWAVAAFGGGPRHSRLAVLALALALWLALPAAFAAVSTSSVISRTLYVVMVPLAMLVGLAAMTLGNPGRPHLLRLIALVAFVVQAFVSADTLVHQARAHARADSLITERFDAVRAVLELQGEPRGVAVIDPGGNLGEIPLLHLFLPKAFDRPFAAIPAPVVQYPDLESLLMSDWLFICDAPVVILEWRDGGLRPSETLPAIPRVLPSLFLADRNEKILVWHPSAPVPPRGIKGLSFSFPPRPSLSLHVRVSTDRGIIEGPLFVDAEEEPRTLELVLDMTPAWVLGATLEAVALEGGPWPALEPPVLTREVPRLVVVRSEGDQPLMLGNVPRLEITGAPAGSDLEVNFQVKVGAIWVSMSYRKHVATGSAAAADFVPKIEELVHSEFPGLAWHTISALFEQHLAHLGVKQLELRYRAAALSPNSSWVRARSPWQRLVVDCAERAPPR